MSILDRRFRYVPAVSTDVTATWRRFGFDTRQNDERRARFTRAVAAETTPPVLALVSSKPQC